MATDRYCGLDWDTQVPSHLRDLILWQRHREEPYCHAELLQPVYRHLIKAGQTLFTPKQLVVSEWFERMADAYTRYRGVVLMGAASTGKSHFTGFVLLMDYIADMGNVFCNLVSTSKDMLLLRSMASAVEYLNYLTQNGYGEPLKFVAQKCAIVPSNVVDADIGNVKSMIKGVAIKEGSIQDSKSAVMGVHLPRVRSVADEFENMGDRAQGFLEAQDNLAMAPDYKVLFLFNPQSIYAPGCRLAEPRDGWDSVDPETADQWETSEGYCVLRFDGHKSPGLRDPITYSFLPTQKTIEEIKARNHGNTDSPGYWTFVRAFPPKQGSERTIVREIELAAGKSASPVIWKDAYTRIAALDPAFTSDGDDCVLVLGAVGQTSDGIYVLNFDRVLKLALNVSDARPILQQIVEQVQQILATESIPIDRFGCDDSGTQSVADAITMAIGSGIYRANFAARAPDVPASVADAELASRRYGNFVTYLWYTLAEFVRFGQVRGLPAEAAEQFCSRRLLDKLPIRLESKKDYKKRYRGQSPDVADACAILAGVARQRVGLAPGASFLRPTGATPNQTQVYMTGRIREMNNLALDENNYLAGYDGNVL